MRGLVQRVSAARVRVAGQTVGEIGRGLLLLVGVGRDDTAEDARNLARTAYHLRIFDDAEGRMNLSVADVGGAILVVSQFTLYGRMDSGRRPSFAGAAPAGRAEPLVEAVNGELRALGARVATGRFGAHMDVELTNEGPVTLMLET